MQDVQDLDGQVASAFQGKNLQALKYECILSTVTKLMRLLDNW
jgi:hypothetical protein